jgi:hypothetical protein
VDGSEDMASGPRDAEHGHAVASGVALSETIIEVSAAEARLSHSFSWGAICRGVHVEWKYVDCL